MTHHVFGVRLAKESEVLAEDKTIGLLGTVACFSESRERSFLTERREMREGVRRREREGGSEGGIREREGEREWRGRDRGRVRCQHWKKFTYRYAHTLQ